MARRSEVWIPLQAANCCRSLCPQQPAVAELQPEWLQDGDKDARRAPRGWRALAVPTGFPLSSHCFPAACLSVWTPAIPEHVSLSFARTVPSTRGAACHFPPQILHVKFQLSSRRCHSAISAKPSSGPQPEESSHSWCARNFLSPLAALGTLLLVFLALGLTSHVSRSLRVFPSRDLSVPGAEQ